MNPFRYAGEYFDVETGTYYLRARYYAPDVGRFTQSDPAEQGTNYYIFCGNDPINNVDPSGLWFTPVSESALVYLNTHAVVWSAYHCSVAIFVPSKNKLYNNNKFKNNSTKGSVFEATVGTDYRFATIDAGSVKN